jgi:2-C-methyl-D-erythritol 4-phosphate cytidylyltransferase
VYTAAIVVAAGRGTRLGTATAKAFVQLGSTPMAVYSLRTIAGVPRLRAVVLVVPPEHQDQAAAILGQYGPWPVPMDVIHGGVERQDSVAAGLARVEAAADLVIVHDAARPFVSFACLTACIEAAAAGGAAIVAVPAHDTVKVVDGSGVIVDTPDRRTIWLAQTPQVFRTALLRQAYERARHDGFIGTDDAALGERLGAPVRVVPGEPTNRKITTPDDLLWAESHLRAQGAGPMHRQD